MYERNVKFLFVVTLDNRINSDKVIIITIYCRLQSYRLMGALGNFWVDAVG